MNVLLDLGIILIAALAVEKAVKRLNIPSITIYILLGVLLGPSLLDITGTGVTGGSELLSNVVLALIAFQIGSNFHREEFMKIGKTVVVISLLEATLTWLLVTAGTYYVAAQSLHIAFVYGAIAAATAPAATMLVIRQYGAKGTFTNTLIGIVAIDDAWGIILFSFSLFVAVNIEAGGGVGSGLPHVFMSVGAHLLLSVLIGSIIACIIFWGGPYIKSRGDAQTFILGALFLSTGTSIYLDISPLFTNIVFGAVLVNIDNSAFRFFDHLKKIDWPLYIMFYVLVGVNFRIEVVSTIGLVAAVYIVFRVIGKISGAYVGGAIIGAGKDLRNYIGLALLPQAGVALGLALLARTKLPEIGAPLLVAITATTIIYELFGPMITRYSLVKAGEIKS